MKHRLDVRELSPTSSNSELKMAARGGTVTLFGSSFSAVMGFVLSFVLARKLGASGSGVVLQAVAGFTIALSLARLGMDTTAVWLLPQLRRDEPEKTHAGCWGLILPSAAAGGVIALIWYAVRGLIDAHVSGSQAHVVSAVSVVAVFLPFGAVSMTALAANRGLGGVLPFNLIGNVLVPLARPLGVLLVVGLGGAAIASSIAWAAPLVVAAVWATVLVFRQVRNLEVHRGIEDRPSLPDRELRQRIFGFALPRTIASALDQSIIWLDVVLVGFIAGAAPAGVYGAASRFVTAGVVVSTALRIVVAPRFSSLLAQGRREEVQDLYTTTACWIVAFGAPVYLLLASFSPTVLGWLGPRFEEGRSSLVILCFGSLVLLSSGNIQSILLMSGHTGWGAVNKLIVATFNVIGNVYAIPRHGIDGAATVWALSMCLDTVLASVQAHRFTGVRVSAGRITATLAATSVCTLVPSWLMITLFGNTTMALAMSGVLAIAMVLGYCYLDRRRLRFDTLFSMRRSPTSTVDAGRP